MKRERRNIWHCIVLKPLKVTSKQLKSFWQLKEFRGANNRAYYGIYHAISAVHALDGNAYKRHKDALANFNKNYVKPEIFPRKLGKKIVESEEIRHASDYDDFYIATREEAEEQIQTAKELVSRVEEYVQARWKKESEKTVRNAEYLVQNRINY